MPEFECSLTGWFSDHDWEVVARIPIEGSRSRFAELDPATIDSHTRAFARKAHPGGLFLHQSEALGRFAAGHNVCLCTGTSSGKTTVFHCAAVEEFAKDPAAKIICLYPLKALANEQEQRWREAMTLAVKNCRVGRISGDVPVKARAQVLRQSQVVVMTPDVMHAWLLPNADDRNVRNYLQHLRLVVVDEAHAYTGVFGSNSAFLFRRLRHLCEVLGSHPRFLAASATIARPQEHLSLLTGLDFSVVDESYNGAMRHPSQVTLLNPPAGGDFLSTLSKLFQRITSDPTRRLIAFVDSRKQVELLTSIAIRGQHDEESDEPEGIPSEDDTAAYKEDEDSLSLLTRLSILPYRSGYEEEDRRMIQTRLSDGSLRGVISTSALELGIDIPTLDTCVLVGVPASSTSLRQRIGRVGRHRPGDVYVVNTGSIYDGAVFAEPELLLTRPPAEGALYLMNKRIQYIHALCLARLGGEHDKVACMGAEDFSFASNVEFPGGFVSLCGDERTGQVPVELQLMKHESGDSPNHAFPLRDVEASFKLFSRNGPEEYSLGSLTYSQCLREAYPGAVYRYATRAYRVYQVNLRSKEIRLRRERGYVTRPLTLPTLVYPNLLSGNLFQRIVLGELQAVECNLQVRESLNGFSERRGNTEFTVTYPHINARASFSYLPSSFFRYYFTSGIVFFHPAISAEGVNRDLLLALLYEAFLLTVPFERNDVNKAVDKMRTDWEQVHKDTRFLSIYDSTYGSLHLTGKFLEPAVLRQALNHLRELAGHSEADAATRDAAMAIGALSSAEIEETGPVDRPTQTLADSQLRIIMPGSSGIHLTRSNEIFMVVHVFWNPKENCLCYKGRLESMLSPDDMLLTPVEHVQSVSGASIMGTYNIETGEITPD